MDGGTFFWHDYETFGRDPRRDRPAQFAGVRTDAGLNEVEPPVVAYCRPAPDFLPDPEACLLTGITPHQALAEGLPEHEFAALVERELGRGRTCGVGYNSIRFDDEVTRFLFWRNLIDPYAREWGQGNSRWDLLDVVRATWSLRPDGLNWPEVDGAASFRLELLGRANDLAHESAHDALSDVRATLALARLLRRAQPKLFDFCLKLRRKDAVWDQIGQGRPFAHVSGRYPVARGCLAVVWPLGPHPVNRNELIVWDLAEDPAQLESLDAAAISARLFVAAADLPEGVARLPIKTIHVNRSPVVFGNLKALGGAVDRWGIDRAAVQRHAEQAARLTPLLAGRWSEVFAPRGKAAEVDVDQDLYGGFVGDADRRLLTRLRQLAPEALAARRLAFDDARLEELVFRYRARNFAQTLDDAEREAWRRHCAARLHEGAVGAPKLADWRARIDALAGSADGQGLAILQALVAYAGQIAPET